MKYTLYFLAATLLIILVSVKTSNTGGQSAMVIERSKVDYVSLNLVDKEPVTKAYINGEEVLYNAASLQRCDELYKYLHLIGYGNLEGSKQMVYLYRWNLEGYFVTISELLAIYNDKHKHT